MVSIGGGLLIGVFIALIVLTVQVMVIINTHNLVAINEEIIYDKLPYFEQTISLSRYFSGAGIIFLVIGAFFLFLNRKKNQLVKP